MSDYKSRREQRVLCEAWKKSGLTKAKFCRQNNIGRRTFHAWLRQLRNDGDNIDVTSDAPTFTADPIKFLKVCNATPQRSFTLEPGLMEVSLANGTSLKVAVSQDNINNFLQELLKWK